MADDAPPPFDPNQPSVDVPLSESPPPFDPNQPSADFVPPTAHQRYRAALVGDVQGGSRGYIAPDTLQNIQDEQQQATAANLARDWSNVGKGFVKGVPASIAGGALGDIESTVAAPFGEKQTYIPTTLEGGYLGPRGFGLMSPPATPEEAGGMTVGSMLGPGAAIEGVKAIQALRGARQAATLQPLFSSERRPMGVTLSEGEFLDDLAKRQAEQNLIRRGGAEAWQQQRSDEIAAAEGNIARGLDPFGQVIASTPQEAGEIVSQSVQNAAQLQKQRATGLYTTAKELPGEINAGVFEGMGQKIKGDLTLGDNPVIIDRHLTPASARMINYLNGAITKLKIQNLADPFGPPSTENIVGVSLKGVEQWRKNLSAYRQAAFASGNKSDARAAQAILNSFDEHIDDAVNGGMFSGDKAAVEAWNNARAAHSDYRGTFTQQGSKDAVGRVVQKIIGDKINDPLTPTKVVDQLIGSTGITPSSLNIAVSKRIKTILGENSTEWSAVKQGVFSRLTQAMEGETALGTGAKAQRLSKFLNSDIAPTIYSPTEMATIRSYADLMRKITMPPGSYFPSAPGINQMLSTVANRTAQVIGAIIGRTVTPGIPLVGEFAGITIGSKMEKILERMHGGVQKQLPIISEQMQNWQRAQIKAQANANWATRQKAVAATVGLQKALQPLGIDLRNLSAQLPATTAAEPSVGTPNSNQQEVPGPPPQQQNGGGIGDKQNFAHGGSVFRKLAHAKVAYTPHSPKRNKRCAICRHFVGGDPPACRVVQSPIDPDGWCRRYLPKRGG